MTVTEDVMHQPSGDSPAPDTGKHPGTIVRTWRVARTVARDPAGTASLIALLVGVILSWVPEPKVWGPGLHSVGYGLVGGAAFSFIYQFWANDALVGLISQRIKSSQERAFQEIKEQWSLAVNETKQSLNGHMDQLVSMHKRHWPLDIYPEGNSPNVDFNHRLEADLRQASRYDFRGQTGKHLAGRLLTGDFPKLRAIRIIIEDPTISDVMEARIDEKRFNAPDQFDTVSDAELQDVILRDLLDSLMGFYAVRARFDGGIELAYASRPTDVRIEIVDSLVYISPFVGRPSKGSLYPEVFRYDSQSVPAEVATLEFNREFGLLSELGMKFTSRTTAADLLSHLRSKGFDLPTSEFNARRQRSEQSLRLLGRAFNHT